MEAHRGVQCSFMGLAYQQSLGPAPLSSRPRHTSPCEWLEVLGRVGIEMLNVELRRLLRIQDFVPKPGYVKTTTTI